MGTRLLLIDALNLVRRVYAAQPGDDTPEKADGAKISSKQSLQRALRETEPTHAVIVFEGREPSWRHLLYRDYKIDHKPMPDALRQALPAYREAFAELGVTSFEVPKVEADDVVATLAVKIAGAGSQAVILSTDKIFLQLLSDNVFVRDHFKQEYLDRGYALKRFGVTPEQFVDFLALTGDSTNSIRGVPGIGPKTAAKLMADFGTLDAILAASEAAEAGRDAGAAGSEPGNPPLSSKLADKLQDHAEDARQAKSLVRLQTDLALGLNLKDLRYRA